MPNIRKILILSSFVLIPSMSWACSVCGGALAEDKADAYLVITALLVSMPILMFCLIGVWVYKRYKHELVA